MARAVRPDDDAASSGARSGALTALAVGVAVFAVHAAAAPSAAPALARPGQPAVVLPATLARLLPVGDVGAREQWMAAALVGLAAALVTWVVAAARGDRAATLGGAVAGLWLAATPAGWALASSLGVDVVALAACAALYAAHDRLARGGGAAAAAIVGGAGAAAMIADGRSAMAATVVGALVVYRGRRGARWIALAPAYAGVVAAALIGAAAIAGGPRWPAAPVLRGLEPWLATLVDDLGPVALVAGGLGVAMALRARGDRWLAAALVAGLVAALPPSRPVAPAAIVALAIGIGWAVAAAARAATLVTAGPMAGATTGSTAGLATGSMTASTTGSSTAPRAVAVVLGVMLIGPPALRSAGTALERDRARVSSYAAAPWKSSPATGR